MIILDVRLDNFYAFKGFHVNFTYPKKIVGSSIESEHLVDRPNFRYKKVNVIMGANASGKTTFGQILMKIFNFIERKNYDFLAEAINDRSRDAFFSVDIVIYGDCLYRITCTITPNDTGKYTPENFILEIRKENISHSDSYESCVKKMESAKYVRADNYIEELEKIETLDWMFEYPSDIGKTLKLPDKDEKFRAVLEHILKALDPSILSVAISTEVKKTYVIRMKDRDVVLQDGEGLTTPVLSSGTKNGVAVACMIFSIMQSSIRFFYCDEKFSYIHSDVERAALSLMIELLRPNSQLFFTTHNTDILNMNLPKHSFTFLRKDMEDAEHPITAIAASSFLKRNTDSIKNAVENDLFSCAPAVDLIYAIADL